MSLDFRIEARAGKSRAARLTTSHGEIETPVFMPVGTAATVKSVPQDVLEELGVEILLGNTYHLYLRPGVETVRNFGGLHGFMAWPRAILTDSGGFQVFSLNDLRKVTEEGVTFRSHLDGSSHFFSPESAMQAQIGLGADIIMAFDECTEYPADRARTKASMELTLRWAQRSKKYFDENSRRPSALGPQLNQVPRFARNDNENRNDNEKGDENNEPGWNKENHVGTAAPGCPSAQRANFSPSDSALPAKTVELRSTGQPGAAVPTNPSLTQSLFGIVQGGMDLALRKESAERTIEIGFAGYAIGGLSVGEPRERTREVIEATLEYLPKDKPRYVMGVGTPEEIEDYARLGVDMMDCVLPTRAARHGLLFTSEGKISIKQARYAHDPGPLDPKCGCRVCRRYSRAYLRHLYASNEVLAQVLNTLHNLSFYLDTMRRVRHSIRLGEESRSF